MCTCGKGNILIWVRNMLRKNLLINFARKYSANVFRLAQIYNHLPEDLKEKFEEFSPLFLVDEELERCPPDSKCIIGKILLQIKRSVVKAEQENREIFLRSSFIEMVFRIWIRSRPYNIQAGDLANHLQ